MVETSRLLEENGGRERRQTPRYKFLRSWTFISFSLSTLLICVAILFALTTVQFIRAFFSLTFRLR